MLLTDHSIREVYHNVSILIKYNKNYEFYTEMIEKINMLIFDICSEF